MRKLGEEGMIWDDETMAAFLAKPRAMVKKTRMSFAGLKKEEDIEALIAYLHSLE
jgi:cytochrome c